MELYSSMQLKNSTRCFNLRKIESIVHVKCLLCSFVQSIKVSTFLPKSVCIEKSRESLAAKYLLYDDTVAHSKMYDCDTSY